MRPLTACSITLASAPTSSHSGALARRYAMPASRRTGRRARSSPAAAPTRSFLSQDAIQAFYRLLAALLICAVLAVLSDSFLSLGNILNVLRQASLTFFIASGLTLVVLTAGLDLSVGANVALSACIAGTVIHTTGSPTLGILTGLA